MLSADVVMQFGLFGAVVHRRLLIVRLPLIDALEVTAIARCLPTSRHAERRLAQQ